MRVIGFHDPAKRRRFCSEADGKLKEISGTASLGSTFGKKHIFSCRQHQDFQIELVNFERIEQIRYGLWHRFCALVNMNEKSIFFGVLFCV